MSDKQREKHLAMYWQGPLTRAEAQKVFDETAQVIKAHHDVITKLDAIMTFLAERAGVKAEEVNEWMKEKLEAAQSAEKSASVSTSTAPSTMVKESLPDAILF